MEQHLDLTPKRKPKVHWCKAISQEKKSRHGYWAFCDPYSDVYDGGDSPDDKKKCYWESTNDSERLDLTWEGLSLNDWMKISKDGDDLEGIIDYLEPASYDGFIDLDDDAYKERKCKLLGMTYRKPPPILVEKVEVTRSMTVLQQIGDLISDKNSDITHVSAKGALWEEGDVFCDIYLLYGSAGVRVITAAGGRSYKENAGFVVPTGLLTVSAASIIGPQTHLDFGRCDGYGLMDQWAVLLSLTERWGDNDPNRGVNKKTCLVALSLLEVRKSIEALGCISFF
ncbi:hypothetical protein Tco_0704651 [Tanacetum coccineum]|uniref:Cyclic nucleotide-binding domain-containing protein n=1 Tax=Tanacetum coccineum TaxID=301880 RepID=A0ABQ4Y382_9ASTR